jgi:thioredoxin-like negative regulator of GroEL
MRYLYFTSEYCVPCKQLKPKILKHPEITIVDIDKYSEKATQYGIMSIPTLLILDHETVEQQVSGSRINKWLNENFKN